MLIWCVTLQSDACFDSKSGLSGCLFHGGEMPGYNSFMGYDPQNDVTRVIWASLTLSLDGKPTANTLMLKILDQIYAASPLQ